MTPRRLMATAGVAVFVAVLACAERRPFGEPTPPPAEGAINLLDAEHAPHWKETRGRKGIFTIEEGVLYIPGSLGQLKYVGYMGEEFGDFELHIEFKLSKKANSGVLLRAQPDSPHETGLEVQVLDSHGKDPDKHSCGAIYDVVTPMFDVTRPPGEWNSYDITMKGSHIVVVHNGWKIIDTDLSQMTMPIGKFDTPYAKLPGKGYLFLQDHHHDVWYRNIYIKKL
jgi:hypothetical protein